MRIRLEHSIVLLVIALGGLLPAQDDTGTKEGVAKPAAAKPAKGPRASGVSPETRAALKHAAEVAAAVKGLKGEARLTALERGAKAYEDVAAACTADKPGCAQASFEAAELWRRRGDLGPAQAGYTQAAELDAGRYAQRALLEIGHMQRHQKRYDEAIATYVRAAEAEPASSRARDARLSIGKCCEAKGDIAGATQAYRHALEAVSQARDVIEVCDSLAKLLVKSSQLDEAEETIRHAEDAVRGEIAAGGPEADRIQKALMSMSARKALQRARDKASLAPKDAEQLDKDKDG